MRARESSAYRSWPRGGLLVSLLVLNLSVGCREPVGVAPSAVPEILGRELYDERLSDALGVPFSSTTLIDLTERAENAIVPRMNRLAAIIEPGSEWPEVFSRLQRDHPADVATVLESYQAELARSAAFVREHRLAPMPTSEPLVVEVENVAIRRNYPLAIYLNGRLGITTAAGRGPDPSYLANHCRICIPPLAVHEGFPGHHLAFARLGYRWDAADRGGGPKPLAQLDGFNVEGWGLYSELLMLEQGYYTRPGRELGAWRMILLRVVRARIDAALHGRDLTAEEARTIYREKLQLSAEAAATEVRRHLSDPLMKATYFVGMMQLVEMRRRALAVNPRLSLLQFHDRVLEKALPYVEVARRRFGLELGSPGTSWLEGAPLLVGRIGD